MPRLARRSAASDVLGRVERLSDVLLGEEVTAIGAVERAFVDRIPAGTKLAVAAVKQGLTAAQRAGVPEAVVALGAQAVEASVGIASGLFASAVDHALTALKDELAVCERTLSTRYAGIGERAHSLAYLVGDQWVALAEVEYAKVVGDAVQILSRDVTADWRAAMLYDEDAEKLTRRLFSPDQVRLAGHSGRGAWWKPYSEIAQRMREVEFLAVNGIRAAAFGAFNDEYEAVA